MKARPVVAGRKARLHRSATLDALPRGRALAVTIGTFDGLHLGHRKVLDRLVEAARRKGLEPAVITILNHDVKHPGAGALQSPEDRRRDLEDLGIRHLIELSFDDVRRLTYEDFLHALTARSRIGLFAASRKLRIGCERKGTPAKVAAALRRLAPGIEILTLPSFERKGRLVSSSTIRKALASGKVDVAADLLGRPWAFSAPVIRGKRLGRTIGYPTLNQVPPPGRAMPAEGVYATRVEVAGVVRAAMTFVGRAWTGAGSVPPPVLVESHLFDFAASVYDRVATVSFVKRLRPVRVIRGLDDLKEQLARDGLDALRALGSRTSPERSKPAKKQR